MSLQKTKVKKLKEPRAQVLKFPSNPESIQELMKEEALLQESINRSETYDERVEVRKDLRQVRERLREAIKHTN